MAQSQSILLAPLPKSVRVIGIPLAAFLLTTFFILLGFPYHHLTGRAAAMASRAFGVEITAEDSGLSLARAGPGFAFSGITVETPTGDVYPVDRMRFGPAWALSWFVADPTIFFEVDSHLGRGEGRIRTGDAAAWSGQLRDVRLDDLHFLEAALPVKLTGVLNANGNVHTDNGVLTGPVEFAVQGGILAHPDLPLEIPFETLDGAIALGGENLLRVDSFSLVGPLLQLRVTGTVSQAEKLPDRALDLDLEFAQVQPQMRPIIETFGVRFTRDGSAKLHVGGTLSSPVVR